MSSAEVMPSLIGGHAAPAGACRGWRKVKTLAQPIAEIYQPLLGVMS
jgi:hypothetical protein